MWILGLAAAAYAEGAERYRVEEAVVSGELAVWPVVDTRVAAARVAEVQLLPEAIGAGTLKIEEVEGGSVPTLRARNTGTRAVLLLAGDVVTGGKQDRVVVADTVIPATGTAVDFAVNCVEQGRWSAGAQGHTFGYGGKGELDLKRTVEMERDQGATWSKVAELNADKAQKVAGNAAGELAPSTGTYRASLETEAVVAQRKGLVDAIAPRVDRVRDVVGLVVAIDGKIVGAELFGRPAVYESAERELLAAFALDAVSDTTDDAPGVPTRGEAEAWLQHAFATEGTPIDPTAGLAREKLDGAHVEGTVLKAEDGTLEHINLYTK